MNHLSCMGALAMIWITALQPVLSASEIPRPLITVKRELGDPNTKLPPIGIVGLDDFSKLYIYSPEKRLLGQTQAVLTQTVLTQTVLTQTEYKTETLKRIQQGRSHYLMVGYDHEPSTSVHYLREDRIVGYMPISYHNEEPFLQQMYALPGDCRAYLQGKTLPETLNFECYQIEHDDYIEEYVIDLSSQTPFPLRGLIIDAFYPRELKAHSKKEIQRTIEHTIAREVL